MKFDNHWLNESYQEVTVHLKKQLLKYNQHGKPKKSVDAITGKTEHLGCHEDLFDVEEGKPRSMTVKVKRHGLSLHEKLKIVVAAALKEFADDVNGYMRVHYLASMYPRPEGEADIIIDPKFFVDMPNPVDVNSKPMNHGAMFAPPEFINEKPPMTKVMSDVQAWVKKKQTKHLTTAQAMLASTAGVK